MLCFQSTRQDCVGLVCWVGLWGRSPWRMPSTRLCTKLGDHLEWFLMMEIYGAKYLFFGWFCFSKTVLLAVVTFGPLAAVCLSATLWGVHALPWCPCRASSGASTLEGAPQPSRSEPFILGSTVSTAVTLGVRKTHAPPPSSPASLSLCLPFPDNPDAAP